MRTNVSIPPLLPVLLLTISLSGCLNPFAPTFDDSGDPISDILGDQRTIEGAFKNFRYAYTTQDTLIYGRLLARDFVFVYTDYDRGIDVSWGRDEDMRATYRLFNSTKNIDLIWNEIITQSGDSLQTAVRRSFSLTITFTADDIVRVGGYANLLFERPDVEAVWRIKRWTDESNY
jgi:hypothetical protein